ncbi:MULTISPECIES: NAD(P)/FAD-dependent oxidoreductase [unclassified Methylobacterium]|jgi:hydrogen cyanide synthase HcnC|uniref:NAD(P)/FAD-dependent oxidoreductase n=1 Tax=unclassified Methylobacterium TaxID=2615210 RepID=UPI0013550799|nr:FAD-dependent oxidoreductase [Methylobacterium sp. 2A]MWV20542.1 FAD-binding oxidoreductase [Methylobacterium sp. 2A]
MTASGHAMHDAIVIGGGLVGAAIAYGLQRQGLSTVMLDEGDVAHRASRGNFGLVWVQSKGLGAPHYQHWTHASARAWPQLAADLLAGTGIDVGLHQPGGLHFCFSDDEMAQRDALMGQLRREAGNAGYEYRMIPAAELRDMVPGLGPQVVGASWTPYDGHASPLHLLRALHAAFQDGGGLYRPNARVTAIKAAPRDFAVAIGSETVRAPRLVLASGLGNADLAPLVGLSAPLRPERGQILVTERTRQVLALPTHVVRQTEEGSLLLGDSKEDMGFDTLTQTPAIMRAIARKAVQTFPWIAELNIVRAWAALRVMSPDGKPIYDQSERYPGATIANCHSGVTLAGAHAGLLAPMIATGALAPDLSPFSARRFDVQKAA